MRPRECQSMGRQTGWLTGGKKRPAGRGRDKRGPRADGGAGEALAIAPFGRRR